MNYLEQAGQAYPVFFLNDSLRVRFTLKEPAKNARLFYLTTGHGGWGNGDEFNQKPNTVYLDGKKVISFIPGAMTAERTVTPIPARATSQTA